VQLLQDDRGGDERCGFSGALGRTARSLFELPFFSPSIIAFSMIQNVGRLIQK
jgi:hypothetical protein